MWEMFGTKNEEQVSLAEANKRVALQLSCFRYVSGGTACVWRDTYHAGKRNVTAEQTLQRDPPICQLLRTVVSWSLLLTIAFIGAIKS